MESQPPSDPAVAPTQKSPATSSGFVPPEPAELAARFPQLEILELLGKGGMGAVYKARQPGLDRLVAVKILPPDVSHDPAFAERFTREARALARLSHPHIVAVHDFGQTDGLYYFVMEYVDGANLRQAIHAGRMTPKDALAIVPQICEALQFAHEEGIVHRDVKPENILIDRRGRVKIADFGLAKLLGHEQPDHGLTATHQVMGTLRYMAPEQMQGSKQVDHRADIYSLGVVFYELLTGELPIGRFAPPSKKVQIDVRLDEVVLRALETEPERRWQQASDVRTEVEAIRSSAPNPVRVTVPAPATDHASPGDGRQPTSLKPEWFSSPAWVRRSAHTFLLLVYLGCLVQIFGYRGGGGVGPATEGDAPAGAATHEIGRPVPWLVLRYDQSGYRWELNFLSLSALIAIAGVLVLAFDRRLSQWEGERRESYRWHVLLWSALASLSIGVGLISLRAHAAQVEVARGGSEGSQLWTMQKTLEFGIASLAIVNILLAVWSIAGWNRSRSERAATPSERAERLVSGPAVTLIAVSVLGVLASLLQIVLPLFYFWHRNEKTSPQGSWLLGTIVVASALATVLRIVCVVAGFRMLRMTHRGLGVTASVLSLLPLDFAFPLSAPVGIWSLSVLFGQRVRDEFARRASESDFETTPENRVVTPAVLQIVAAAIGVLTWLIGPSSLVTTAPSTGHETTLRLSVALALSMLLLSIVALAGAVCLLLARNRTLAVTGAILSLIPTHIGWLLGLPSGIWALRVLSRHDVRDLFRRNRDLTPPHESEGERRPEDLEKQLRFAGTRLTATGFATLAAILPVSGLCIGFEQSIRQYVSPQFYMATLSVFVWWSLIAGTIIARGGMDLRRREGRTLATVGSWMAMAPLSPVVVLGFPAGFRCLKLLRHPDVDGLFESREREKEAERAVGEGSAAHAAGFVLGRFVGSFAALRPLVIVLSLLGAAQLFVTWEQILVTAAIEPDVGPSSVSRGLQGPIAEMNPRGYEVWQGVFCGLSFLGLAGVQIVTWPQRQSLLWRGIATTCLAAAGLIVSLTVLNEPPLPRTSPELREASRMVGKALPNHVPSMADDLSYLQGLGRLYPVWVKAVPGSGAVATVVLAASLTLICLFETQRAISQGRSETGTAT